MSGHTNGTDTPTLKRVVVKRSEWHRGKGFLESYLLICEGMKCCLGFLCLADGLSEDQIRRRAYPFDASIKVYSGEHTVNWMKDAARMNDDFRITDAEREVQIATLGRANGYEFVFED